MAVSVGASGGKGGVGVVGVGGGGGGGWGGGGGVEWVGRSVGRFVDEWVGGYMLVGWWWVKACACAWQCDGCL